MYAFSYSLCKLMSFLTDVSVSGDGGEQTAGENHALTCQVTGGGTMTTTYQWLKDGAPLSGQTSETLSFSPLRQMDNGSYTCEGTRNSTSVTSASVSITVRG